MRIEVRLHHILPRLARATQTVRKAELFLLSNAEMNVLKHKLIALRQFRGPEARKIKAEQKVNILSFSEPKDFPSFRGEKVLGEIYVNREWGTGHYHDLLPLVIHGFLHLLGYRHGRTRDRIAMEKKEHALLAHLR